MSNELIYLSVHFCCGCISLGIVAYTEYRETGELTVDDLSMLWMIPLGCFGLLLCLVGVWLRFFEKHQGKTLISRRKTQRAISGKEPEYVPERWKEKESAT